MAKFPDQFRYFLTYESNRTQLIFAPKGWDDQTIGSYKRDMTYWGLIRSLTLPLEFVNDGKDIIVNAYLKYGIEAGVKLEVEMLQNDLTYLPIFVSDLDFSQYDYDNSRQNGSSVKINCLESGISRDIKSNENTKFEYPLVGDDVVNIVLPGIRFNDSGIFVPTYTDTSNLNAAKKYVVGITVTKPFEAVFLDSRSIIQRNASDSDNFDADSFIVGRRVQSVPIRISGNIDGSDYRSLGANRRLIYLEIRSTFGNLVYRIHQGDPLSFGDTPFSESFDFTYNIANNEGLYLYARTDLNDSGVYIKITNGQINIDYANVSDPSNCKGIRAADLYKRIINRVSPTAIPNSTILNGIWKNLIFTSGTAIRELQDASIKITFKEFFDTINGLMNSGFGIVNGQARLEAATFFARNISMLNVGNVNEANFKPATDLMFKKLTIGYSDGNTNESDGREEFNSEQQYDLPFSVVDTDKSLVSPTRADQFGIEQIRVKYNIKRTDDNDYSSDNDTFMIDCEDLDTQGNYRPLLGSSYTLVTGLTFPSDAYNLRISPRQNLLRQSPLLASILDKQNNRSIRLASGNKNTKLKTVKQGVTVQEDSQLNVSSLNDQYFIPTYATIIAKLPKFAINIIDSNPFGAITFSYNGVNYDMYIMDIDTDLSRNTEQTIKGLLCSLPLVQNIPVVPTPQLFSNVEMSAEFTKNDCQSGIGSKVIYTVESGTYQSAISQYDADNLAQSDIIANGQQYANDNGSCI